jgi:hypothetical protein
MLLLLCAPLQCSHTFKHLVNGLRSGAMACRTHPSFVHNRCHNMLAAEPASPPAATPAWPGAIWHSGCRHLANNMLHVHMQCHCHGDNRIALELRCSAQCTPADSRTPEAERARHAGAQNTTGAALTTQGQPAYYTPPTDISDSIITYLHSDSKQLCHSTGKMGGCVPLLTT